jgi:hypothetical protein
VLFRGGLGRRDLHAEIVDQSNGSANADEGGTRHHKPPSKVHADDEPEHMTGKDEQTNSSSGAPHDERHQGDGAANEKGEAP